MSYAIQFLIIVVLSLLACSKVTLQGRMSRQHVHGPQDSIWFNALMCAALAIWLALLFPLAIPDATTLLYGMTAGTTTVVFQSCYAIALATGPVSLTSLIVNFSVLLITGFGIAAFGDHLYLSQLAGVMALVVSMILSVELGGEQKKAHRRWLVLALLTLLSDAAGSCMQRLFKAGPSAAVPGMDATFLVVMYASASLWAFAIYTWNSRHGRRETSSMGFKPSVLIYAVLIALVLGTYQKTSLFALSYIEGTFLYPTHVGMISLFMTLIGIVLFRDRLTVRQKWAVVCGIACVVLMNLRLGPSIW